MITRYGGSEFWQYIAERFHEKLKSDGILREYFDRRTNAEASMINFNIFRAGFGEESQFYEQAIKDAHKDRGITMEKINKFLNCLKTVLNEEGVEDPDVQLIISRLLRYGNMIANTNQ